MPTILKIAKCIKPLKYKEYMQWETERRRENRYDVPCPRCNPSAAFVMRTGRRQHDTLGLCRRCDRDDWNALP